LTASKRFCFANPLLPFGAIWEASAHCTHPDEKIGKSTIFASAKELLHLHNSASKLNTK